MERGTRVAAAGLEPTVSLGLPRRSPKGEGRVVKFPSWLGVAAGAHFVSHAGACDLCAVYNANAARGEGNVGFHLALAEQFTHSGTLQQNSKEIPDAVDQYRDSSVTTVIVGYNFNSRIGVSFSVPYIHRSFRRAEGFEVERGTESGLGDASLVARVLLLNKAEHDYSYSISVLGGVEFPTGDPDRLAEEVNEVEIPGAPPSGVHGDDLALGSGSYDGIAGISGSVRWLRAFCTIDAQYFLRTRGKFDYEFGDEVSVTGGPGAYVLFDETKTLAVQAVVGYESKSRDSIEGVKRDEGISSAWYAGPGLTFTWGERFSATLNADLPLRITNRDVDTVPDFRIRGGLGWQF